MEITGDYDYQLRNLSLKDNKELLAIDDIKEYWPEDPPKKSIHVIVESPAPTNASEEVSELKGKVAFYENAFGVNFYGKPSESSKRQYSVYEKDQERNKKKIKGYPAPSSCAMANCLRSIQHKDQELHIGRPYNCAGPPLVLYNPVFSDFKRDYNDEELPMD